MEKKDITVRLGLPLPSVLQELCDKLYSDDWTRYGTQDESSFYYILGMKGWEEDQDSAPDYDALSIPRPQQVSVAAERHVHSGVASPRSPSYYIEQAVLRLEGCGVDPVLTRQFAKNFLNSRAGVPDTSFLAGHVHAADYRNAVVNLFRALGIAMGLKSSEELTDTERQEARELGLQKVYLKEVAKVFEKVVQRAGSLEALTFSDPQLSEASRCYLYGFFRGTVLLSASAVETNLRDALKATALHRVDEKVPGYFDRLVDAAVEGKLLGDPRRMGEEPTLAGYSREIFKLRTRVAHKGRDATNDDAEKVLNDAREVVEFVRQRPRLSTP